MAEAACLLEETDIGFDIRLPVFDGPFELLLHLIQREQLDIFDIPIAKLTSAYLETLEAMRAQRMEPASEFLVVAASLVQIKSRMLLPKAPGQAGEEGEDPRQDLVFQLLEYQRYREVADGLADRVRVGRDVFFRVPGQDRPPDEEETLRVYDPFKLAEVFKALIAKGRYEAPHDIVVERISIAERIAQIADVLERKGRATYEELCVGTRHREERITTFLAVLEMAKLDLVTTIQADRLATLYVEPRLADIGALGEQAAGMLGD